MDKADTEHSSTFKLPADYSTKEVGIKVNSQQATFHLMYHIGYVNANSMYDRKFDQAIGLLKTLFDFLFIAEHWYQHHEARLAHPLVHCSTTLPPRSPNNPLRGRYHGGIYLLVKPHLCSVIQHTKVLTYSITVSLPGFHIAGVYYPPQSISEQTLQANLHEIGPVDILLGDINTKFQTNNTIARRGPHRNPSSRSILFQTWAVNSNMAHIVDPSKEPNSHTIPDHVFSSVQHQPNTSLSLVTTQSLDFRTDHRYLLHVKFNNHQDRHPPHYNTQQFTPSPTRFHVQRLRKADMVKEYQKNWAAMEALFTSFQGSERFDIDMLDALLCSAVQAVAESTLGIYKPHEARKKDDNVAKQLATQLDMPASIELLKRAQRASTACLQLISSTPQSTPMQECIDHYSKIFNLTDSGSPAQPGLSRAPLTEIDSSPPPPSPASPVIQPAPSPQSFQPPDESNLLASGLLDHISIDKIKIQLGRMSSSASCGSDGITVIMLRHLLITTFPKHLHQLYLACIQKGQTPR